MIHWPIVWTHDNSSRTRRTRPIWDQRRGNFIGGDFGAGSSEKACAPLVDRHGILICTCDLVWFRGTGRGFEDQCMLFLKCGNWNLTFEIHTANKATKKASGHPSAPFRWWHTASCQPHEYKATPQWARCIWRQHVVLMNIESGRQSTLIVIHKETIHGLCSSHSRVLDAGVGGDWWSHLSDWSPAFHQMKMIIELRRPSH